MTKIYNYYLEKETNGELLEEQKAIAIENNELKEEIRNLKLANLNVLEFSKWNSEQIVIWCCSLENQRFVKYKDILLKNLTEESVVGKDLKQVEAADIRDWGVINFADRKQLFMHIKNLIQNGDGNNNVNDNNNNNDNDGNDNANLNDDNIAVANEEEGAMSGGFYR